MKKLRVSTSSLLNSIPNMTPAVAEDNIDVVIKHNQGHIAYTITSDITHHKNGLRQSIALRCHNYLLYVFFSSTWASFIQYNIINHLNHFADIVQSILVFLAFSY